LSGKRRGTSGLLGAFVITSLFVVFAKLHFIIK
jgi:hypothetical protein